MRKSKRPLQLLLALLLFLHHHLVFAQITPKFSIIPMVKPPLVMPSNSVVLAQYFIRNNTSLPRTLTMVPQEGINQIIEPGTCTAPFSLLPGQTCYLKLQLIGSLMPGGVHSGPVVCKTMGPDDNRPDAYLCSQTAPGDNLEVSLSPSLEPVTLSVSPSPLTFSTRVGASVTVINTSTTASAINVVGRITSNPNFSVSATTCLDVLVPGAACKITFNSAVAGSATANIEAANAAAIPINLTAVAPTISVSPTFRAFIAEEGALFTVTNTSMNGALAQNVTANIPPGSNFFIRQNTCPPLLAPMESCTITLDTTVTTSGTIPIQGSNTNAVDVTLEASALVSLQVNPMHLFLGVNGTGTVTVTNTSTTPALNVTASVSAPFTVSNSTCPLVLAPGSSCLITYTSSAVASDTSTIAGTNTKTVTITVTALQASLEVSPNPFTLVIDNEQSVTVKNTSVIPAENVVATPPGGSTISVVSSTCPPTLLPLQSCFITFSSSSASPMTQSVLISGTNTTPVTLPIAVVLANINATPSSVVTGSSVLITNNSVGAAKNLTATLPVGSTLTLQNGCASSLASGASCTMVFNGNLTTTEFVTIQGTNTTTTSVTVAPVGISLSAAVLTVTTNGGTGSIDVQNLSTTTSATNIVPTLPVGSSLAVGTNSCTPSLAPAQACSIEFVGGATTETAAVVVKGTNTTVQNLTVNVVAPTLALLHVSSSQSAIVADGVTPTELTIQNDSASEVAAKDLTIKFPPSWTGVSATVDSDCENLAPGASCTLTITSKIPYLPQQGIVIKGSNTQEALVDFAFIAGGGWVFDDNEGNISVASMEDNDANVSLATAENYADALDSNDGEANTNRLLMTEQKSPAALVCFNYRGAGFDDWYLPAKEELNRLYQQLFAHGFGHFSQAHYWSSTENDSEMAWLQRFSLAQTWQNIEQKSNPHRVRCIRHAHLS